MIKIGTDIEYAKTQLDNGGLVAIPTETVYGLGGNALNSKTIEKIFLLKKRPKNDPLICHTYSIDQIEKYVKNIPKTAYKLAEEFWPGPLTLIFEKENIIPDITTANYKKRGDGHFYHVILNGIRNMPKYGHAVSDHERWKIILHLRNLQNK